MGSFLIMIAALVGLSVLFVWLLNNRNKRYEQVYKQALESNQIRLDRHSSQFNIFIKALPSLQKMLLTQLTADTWKTLCIDEIRAMTRSDAVAYWAFEEGEQTFRVDLSRPADSNEESSPDQPSEVLKDFQFALKTRSPLVKGSGSLGSPNQSEIVVPFFVSGQVRGGFHLVRRSDEKLTARDAELVDVFLIQVSMALENREMVYNRERFYLELLQTLADTLDSRDASTEGQTRRARELARAVAKELSLPDQFTYYLEFAALMHDIGKLAIDENLLKKPGKLTPQEFEIIKKHPEFGHKILAPVTMLAPVAPMVLYHQEWYNGKGYPEGLSGEEIPLGARIVGVIDAWAAMTSARPWRRPLTTKAAIEELRKGAGTQFDPKVVEGFIAAVEKQGPVIGK